MRRRARRRQQRGSALVAAVAMVAIMAVLGMALLAMVDVQTVAANRERTADRAFNLAEAVVNLQAGVFSQAWPAALPFTCEGTITGPGGGTSTPSADCAPATLVAGSLAGVDLAGSAWRMTATDAGDGRIRVRASATTVGPRAGGRAAEAVIARRSAPALPVGYSVIANNFSGELGLTLNQVTNISILRGLLGDHRLIQGGKVALRCGLLNGALQPGHDPNVCVTGALGLTGPNGLGGLGDILGLQSIVNYGYETAATPAVMASLRTQASARGTLRTTVSHGAECLPGPVASDAVVYIDRVGAGDGACTITLPAGTTTTVGAVIVDRGRIVVRGSGAGTQPGVLSGAVWGMNTQGIAGGDLVTLTGAVQVRGAVVADGVTGTVGLRPGPNPGTPAAIQAEEIAEDITETEGELGGLTQTQLDQLATLIGDAEAKRLAADTARTTRPYPARGCPVLSAAPDHSVLISRLDALSASLLAVINAATPLPGTAPFVTQLTTERAKVIQERDKLPNPSPCVLLGLDQILDGLFDALGSVLGGVTGLLVGPSGLLAHVQNLVTTLTGTLNGLISDLDTLLGDALGGLTTQGMIIHEPAAIAGLRADGGAGVVADSFRQVAME